MSRLPVLCMLVFLLFLSCSAPDKTYTVEIIDGVKHIHNHAPLWGDEPQVRLKFVQQYGKTDGKDEHYFLYQPTDVIVDSKGDVYVLEMGNCCIKKFSPDGTYIKTIGNMGGGPGELARVLRFSIDRNDIILVSDWGNRRYQQYSADGEDLGSFKLEKFSWFDYQFSDGTLMKTTLPFWENEGRTEPFSVVNRKGEIIREFGEYFDFSSDEMNEKYQDVEVAITNNDYIVASIRAANAVDKYAPDGTHVFRADRPLSFNHAYIEKPITMEMSNGRDFETKSLAVVQYHLGVDHKYRIWVWTYAYDMTEISDQEETAKLQPGEMYELHIFNFDGIFLGNVSMPIKPYRLRIFGDRLFLIENDLEMVVYEYRILDTD